MISRAQATVRHQAEAQELNAVLDAPERPVNQSEPMPFFLAIAATIVGMTLCNIFDAPLLWWFGAAFGPAMLAAAWAMDGDFAEGNGYCDEELKP